MKTATFSCTKCNYTQKTAAENAGNQYSCPQCGAVAYAFPDSPGGEAPRPAAQKTASPASGQQTVARENARPASGQQAGAPGSAAGQQTAVPGPAPQQGMTDKQLSAAMLAASMQQKNLAIGLLLTFFFGGLGTLYASVGWGIFFIILEFLLWVAAFFTLGLILPVIFVFHIICLIFAAVSISNHNKRLIKHLAGM